MTMTPLTYAYLCIRDGLVLTVTLGGLYWLVVLGGAALGAIR
jgi:hypothetical protein